MKWLQLFNPLAWVGFVAGIFVVLFGVLVHAFVAYARELNERADRERRAAKEAEEAAQQQEQLQSAPQPTAPVTAQVVAPVPPNQPPTVDVADDADVDYMEGPPAWATDPEFAPASEQSAAPAKAVPKPTTAPSQMALELVERKSPPPAAKRKPEPPAKPARAAKSEKPARVEQTGKHEKQARYRGTFLSAKWDQRPNTEGSKLIRQFCVRYLDSRGELREVWGNDLKREIEKAGVQCEDRVDIRWLGTEPIDVKDPEHPGEWKPAIRNKWDVRVESRAPH